LNAPGTYDASYMHELIDADPQAILAVGKLQAIGAIARTRPPPLWPTTLSEGYATLTSRLDMRPSTRRDYAGLLETR
jgi:hypothetical protein